MTQTRDSGQVTVDVRLGPDDLATALRDDVRRGLSAPAKELPPKWFYDDRGCELFDQITRLPEYYPTEAERSILVAEAANLVATTGADTIIELGSGTSDKTRTLLDAFRAAGRLRRFVPFDVNETTVRAAADDLVARYPGIDVHAVVGDFEHHLLALPCGGRRMVVFLGSTIGNLVPEQRTRFLTDLAATLDPGDWFLLGTDLVKDVARLEAAYDDGAGVTAEFNRNVLHVVNRELGADFPVDAYDHVARFDTAREWIEMRLRARRAHTVVVGDLDLVVEVAEGEEILTEISAKFRLDGIEGELVDAGFELERAVTDPAGDFALSLARRR